MFVSGVKSVVLPSAAWVALAASSSVLPAQASDATALKAETFGQLRTLIRPQPGESRWMDIPWLIDVHAARQKAAAEGKPLFIYSGGGATGIGAC